MRLDKYLCDLNIGSRKQIKTLLKTRTVTVNGKIALQPELQVNPSQDCIAYQGKVLTYQKYFYYCMNKPAGVITATEDKREKTVMSLFPKEYFREDIFPIGRLDKDTTGLLLFTNDGELCHRLLSSKYHVFKTYLVTTKNPVTKEQQLQLEQGVDIGEERPTLPAKCVICDTDSKYQIRLSIREGKFHQVKRMLQAIDNEVVALKRESFGEILLEDGLAPSAIRPLSNMEIQSLYDAVSLQREGV